MPVFIGSIPNAEKDDIVLAKSILEGREDVSGSIQKLKERLGNEVLLFNRGRESLSFLLKVIDIKNEDEIITQAFTCIAVIAPIIWSGAKPVYVDIDRKSFNLDLDLLKK